MKFRCCHLAGGLLLLGASLLPAPSLPEFEAPPELIAPDAWRLTWKSNPGTTYRLERSHNLLDWEEVDALTAALASTALDDTGTSGQKQTFWRVVEVDGGVLTTKFIEGPQSLPDNEWKLTWASTPGDSYRLERSIDLLLWHEVNTVAAISALTTLVDSEVALGEPRVFWRVVPLGPGTIGLTLSNLSTQSHQDGDDTSITYSLIAGGSETVNGVTFFDGTTPIGSGQRGFGDLWSLTLDWDPNAPTLRNIEAEVSTGEGTVERSEAHRFLLADPSRFVPLSTGGELEYGEFVSAAADGQLDPFLFFPEGIGEAERSSGAHFRFPAGGTFDAGMTPPEILFLNGAFHRGPTDGSPHQISGQGERRIPIDDPGPADIRQSFALPPGPLTLLWGTDEVLWEDGPLNTKGWANLQIRPPIGDFILPVGRLSAIVSRDTRTGRWFLVSCYHGIWNPLPDGPTLEIPLDDPLKIYLDRAGGLRAHGTAEATFPNGGRVRATIAWRYPNFEFRFEGRNGTIPSLDLLRDVLPDNPLACVPAGDSPAELDSLADCLANYQRSFRGLAQGAATQADPAAGTAGAILPSPSDESSTSLRAWAGRIASWNADRSGEVLTPQQAQEITHVVQQSAQLARSAQDLPTVLSIYRDLTVLNDSIDDASDTSPEATALGDAITSALPDVANSVERINAATPEFDSSSELPDLALLVAELEQSGVSFELPPTAPGGPAPRRAPGPLLEIKPTLDRFQISLFNNNKVTPGDTNGFFTHGPGGNPDINNLSHEELLAYLEDLIRYYRMLAVTYGLSSASESPFEFSIEEGLTQALPPLRTKHNNAMAAAVASRDYHALRHLLRERILILSHYQEAGVDAPPGSFTPANPLVALAFQEAVETWLQGVDAGIRSEQYNDNVEILIALNELAQDEVLANLLQRRWLDLSNFNSRFINDRLASGCRGFFEDLTSRGFQLPDLADDFETDHSIPLTGKYESDGPALPYQTLQINQAGRYLIGYLQQHRGAKYRLRGHFLEQENGVLVFGVLRIVDGGLEDGKIVGSGFLTAALAAGDPLVVLSDTSTNQETVFIQNSNLPAFSRETFSFFADEVAETINAQQRAPLHSAQLTALKTLLDQAVTEVTNYTFVDIASSKKAFACNLNELIRQMLGIVDDDAVPLLRLILLQRLSEPPLITRSGVTRSARDRFMLMLIEQPDILINTTVNPDCQNPGQAGILMGDTIYNSTSSGGLYHYVLKITNYGTSADVGIGIGAFDLDVQISKFNPGNDSYLNPPAGRTPDQVYTYDGWLGQVGLGVGLALATAQQSEAVIPSPFPYLQDDLEGPVVVVAASASAANVFGVGYAVSSVSLFGRRTLPSLTWNTSSGENLDFVAGVALTAGLELSGGTIVGENNVDSPEDLQITTAISNFSPTTQAEFDLNLAFKFASAELSDCGRQYLRELVADHRTLFASPAMRIGVLGFTDSKASEPTNEALAAARANTVRNALLEILGPGDPRIPDDHIVAIGLGELPAKIGFPPPGDPIPPGHWLLNVDPEWQSTIRHFGNISSTIPDDTEEQAWRQVIIAINGLVSVKMRGSGATN